MDFTPLSLKIKLLWSSENGRKFNIFAHFEHTSNFGLEVFSYLKENVVSESISLFYVMLCLSIRGWPPLSEK